MTRYPLLCQYLSIGMEPHYFLGVTYMVISEQARNWQDVDRRAKDAAGYIERAGVERRAGASRRAADMRAVSHRVLWHTILVASLFFALGVVYGRGGF